MEIPIETKAVMLVQHVFGRVMKMKPECLVKTKTMAIDIPIETKAMMIVQHVFGRVMKMSPELLVKTQPKVTDIPHETKAAIIVDIVKDPFDLAKAIQVNKMIAKTIDIIEHSAEPIDIKLQICASKETVHSHGDIAAVRSKSLSDISVPSCQTSQSTMRRTSSKSCSEISGISQMSTDIVKASKTKREVDVQIFSTSTSMFSVDLFDNDKLQVEKPKKKKGLRKFFRDVRKFFKKRLICC